MSYNFSFKKISEKKIEFNQYNIVSLALLGSVGHPLFWFLWTYIDPQPYESFYLRTFGFLSCLILFSVHKWSGNFSKLAYAYWVFAVIYNLPFFFTFLLISNNFSQVWLSCELIMMMVVLFAVESSILAIIILIGGIALAVFCATMFYPNEHFLNPVLIHNVPIVLFSITTAGIFSYSNVKGMSVSKDIKHRNAINVVKSFAGSIAHEIRNPLNIINLVGIQIDELLSKLGSKDNPKEVGKIVESSSDQAILSNKQQLLNLTAQISQAISSANDIINIILSDLREKPIDKSELTYLDAVKILPEIISQYGYKTLSEKEKVRLSIPLNQGALRKQNPAVAVSDFIFKAAPERFTFIIYNLLKNALYYLNEYPNSTVTVGIEERNLEGVDYNVIYVHDTGPGIPEKAISKIFDDFYTSGKKDGTGLGLAFCKRNMAMFDGHIICESEVGKWTKFSLLFPKLSQEELTAVQKDARNQKILIVDDQRLNLFVTKAKIEKVFSHITCDIAESGAQAISLIRANEYQLILLDVQMPEMSGIETAKKIISFKKEVPIIALTSLDYEVVEPIAQGCFSYYLKKPVLENILFRAIAKWMLYQDDFSYLGEGNDYLKALQNKSVILADDQELNRMITKNKLTALGMKVTEAKNGVELVEIYKSSLGNSGKAGESQFDMVLTDIHMPLCGGDEAAKKIREIEVANGVAYQSRIPIIALSGDGQREDVRHFFNCQMTDYFIKGSHPEALLKTIAHYFLTDSLTEEDLPKKGDEAAKSAIQANIPAHILPANKDDCQTLDTSGLSSFNDQDRKEFLKVFLKDSEKMVEKIELNSKEHNLKELSLVMHAIKGVSGNIGAEKLFWYIKELETQIKCNKLPENENWLQEFKDCYQDLCLEINRMVA